MADCAMAHFGSLCEAALSAEGFGEGTGKEAGELRLPLKSIYRLAAGMRLPVDEVRAAFERRVGI